MADFDIAKAIQKVDEIPVTQGFARNAREAEIVLKEFAGLIVAQDEVINAWRASGYEKPMPWHLLFGQLEGRARSVIRSMDWFLAEITGDFVSSFKGDELPIHNEAPKEGEQP